MAGTAANRSVAELNEESENPDDEGGDGGTAPPEDLGWLLKDRSFVSTTGVKLALMAPLEGSKSVEPS